MMSCTILALFFPHKSPAPGVLLLHENRSSFFLKNKNCKDSPNGETKTQKGIFAKIVLFNTSFLGSLGSDLWCFGTY